MRAFNVLLSIVVSLAIALLVFEGGLRIMRLGPPKTLNQFDSALGWSKVPGKKVTRKTSEYEVTFEFNEQGLRDDPMADVSKPEGTYRVIALGDSFTLGFGVNRENLFVDHLEEWWSAEERRIEVINTGTEGYSTDQCVAWLEEHGEEYDPDLVLLFPYENDLYWNGQQDYFGKQKPAYSEDGKRITGTLTDTKPKKWTQDWALTSMLFKDQVDQSAHFFKPGEASIPKEFGALLNETPDWFQPSLAGTKGALKALKQASNKLGARAVVVPIPSHSVVDAKYREEVGNKRLGLSSGDWQPDKPVKTFLNLAAEVGLDALDPTSALAAATAGGTETYYWDDWHINEAGTKELARFLHYDLDKMGVFPTGHTATTTVDIDSFVADSGGAGLPFWQKLFLTLWLILTVSYALTYRDEAIWLPPIKVALLLSAVFGLFLGVAKLTTMLSPGQVQLLMGAIVIGVIGLVLYKMGSRIVTMCELLKAFVLRGHWYLMPMVVVLLTIGSLLVVAASSPLIAPFIYTLF